MSGSRHRRKANKTTKQAPAEASRVQGLRIIGGRFRGRKLQYTGDPRTRPMKDRLREAIFNLLGPAVRGTHAIDLFAGTGALGLEALSRGATRATLIERHLPTARVVRRNVAELGAEDVAEVVAASVFHWFGEGPDLGSAPWLVFCSPPYEFYVSRTDEMIRLLQGMISSAPAGSLFAVEADSRFDFALLPHAAAWKVRRYRPAVVGIYRKPEPDPPEPACGLPS